MKSDVSARRRSDPSRMQRIKRFAKRRLLMLRAVSLAPRPPSDEAQARAMIEASGLMLRDWYLNRYPDVAEAGLDPVAHYLAHGGFENRDPGPGFRTQWYLSQIPEAASSGLNPLIHYLVFGKAAGRSPLPAHEPVLTPELALDIETLLSSRLLDTDWYRTHTSGLAKGREAVARHYLEKGANEGKNPGPAFDTRAYWNAYADVEAAGTNPLLHYLRYGRGEGRKIFPVQAESERDPWSEAPEEADEAVDGPWLGADGFQTFPAQDWFSVGEITLGKATPTEQDRWGASVSDFIGATSGGGRSDRRADQRAPSWVGDVWFVSDHTLRLRLSVSKRYVGAVRPLVARAYQSDLSNDAVRLLDEKPTQGGVLSLVDFTLINPYAPLLLTLTDAEGALLEIQTLSFPSLARHGAHHAELAVLSRRSPQDDLWRVSEDLWAEFRNGPAGGLSVGRLNVDLTDALGGERFFSTSCLEWLSRVMGVELSSVGASSDFLADLLPAAPAASRSRGAGSVALTIPADAVPSLSALVSRRLDVAGSAAMVGGYVVADASRARPRWSVFPPAAGVELEALQPRHGPLTWPSLTRVGKSSKPRIRRAAPAFPLAVRFADERFEPKPVERLTPTARDVAGPLLRTTLTTDEKDRFRVSAVVQVSATNVAVETALAGLASQSLGIDDVILLCADERREAAVTLAETYFPGRVRAMSETLSRAALINKAVAESTGDYILFVDADVVVHDPRTLETLAVLARADGAASAGCVAVEEHEGRNGWDVRIQGGGLLPSHVSFISSPRLVLGEARSVSALPPMTYAVAANPFRLALTSRRIWNALDGLDEERFPDRDYDLDFGLRAMEAGGNHLCTSVVSVAVLEGALVDDRVDVVAPQDLDVLAASGWLSRLTTIRELN